MYAALYNWNHINIFNGIFPFYYYFFASSFFWCTIFILLLFDAACLPCSIQARISPCLAHLIIVVSFYYTRFYLPMPAHTHTHTQSAFLCISISFDYYCSLSKLTLSHYFILLFSVHVHSHLFITIVDCIVLLCYLKSRGRQWRVSEQASKQASRSWIKKNNNILLRMSVNTYLDLTYLRKGFFFAVGVLVRERKIKRKRHLFRISITCCCFLCWCPLLIQHGNNSPSFRVLFNFPWSQLACFIVASCY